MKSVQLPRSNACGALCVSHRASSSRSIGRVIRLSVRDDSVLIANTKGGGHAFIGLYLAKELMSKGHKVTILNAGDEAKSASKNPFKQYAELAKNGAQIVWGDPAKPETYPQGSFDVVYDNNGKTIEECKPMIDSFKGKCKHYVFVSSAGMYKADKIEPCAFETDKRSEKNHFFVEEYLKEQKMPFTIFRPMYIYGPHTGKDCEQWFMDRIMRDRPVPIPKPGVQCTSLTHVEDVASMLASVPGNKNAIGQAFNVCSDRTITFNGIAKAIGKAAGKEPVMVYYNPDEIGLEKGEGFPFRTGHFFANVDKAKKVLGWKPKHKFSTDVAQRLEEYKTVGRMDKAVDFAVDDKILAAAKK